MVEIKPQDQELGFDGTNIAQFLDSYQSAAELDGASEYDMAHQICYFMRTEELMDVVEVMDGYEDHDWTTLKVSMLAYWTPVDEHEFTLQDLDVLLWYWSEKEGIAPAEDYPFFCESFEPIVSSLLRNNNRIGLEEIQDLCYEAFSAVLKSVHRSSSDLIPNRINHEINFQTTKDSITCLGTSPTGFSDALSKSVPHLDERNMNTKPELSEQLLEESQYLESLFFNPSPGLNAVKKLTPIISDPEEEYTNVEHKLSKQSTESPSQAEDPLFEAIIQPHSAVLLSKVSLTSKVTDPTESKIKLLPEERGEDHNHFIDRLDLSIHSFDSESHTLAARSTPDQSFQHFYTDTLLSNRIYNLGEHSFIEIEIPSVLGFVPSNLVLPFGGSLGEGDELPLFDFEDSMFHFKSDQALSIQDRLRDENKLPLFNFEQGDISFSWQFSAFHFKVDQDLSFQDTPQNPLCDKNKLSLFYLKTEDLFRELVLPFQDQLRDEDKLSCFKLGRKEEAKWRNWGTKVSPPNCASPRLDTPFVVKTLSCATYVSKTLLLPLSFDSALLGPIAALLLEEKVPATQSIQDLNTQQYLLVQGLSSNQDLDHHSPISGSRFNGVGHIRLFIFVKLHSPAARFT
ncbi:hypothetical protein MJO28_012638 [Puccinia striiformis f. sp. tritici]|uniref:Uncharacterized protein n=3 Tax=Puccinia striiformis TaxID=27350 RepID=A0A0L0VYX8_9BASI|nr:hypothetical protein Pst134EB_023380 [Puccinia striiformis f. sp. tritici]KAI7942611.1 hypothetical protein MJO28_012638 [Puccinia striiformis f. sp. tritici]KNF04489.1 hypothetical protein PSTG_02399 [Puccinia striiformis f. sp. tritici PST-78]POV97441.1 hypothetical protein PSTT_15048 [Puccinia striiformis]